MSKLLKLLEGGDIRQLGKIPEVIKLVGDDQDKFDELFQGIYSGDEIVRIRSADAIFKINKNHPYLLQNHKKDVLKFILNEFKPEVLWQLVVPASTLQLTKSETAKLYDRIIKLLDTKGMNIFSQCECMTALANISQNHPDLKDEVRQIVEEKMLKGSNAIKARGRIILKTIT